MRLKTFVVFGNIASEFDHINTCVLNSLKRPPFNFAAFDLYFLYLIYQVRYVLPDKPRSCSGTRMLTLAVQGHPPSDLSLFQGMFLFC